MRGLFFAATCGVLTAVVSLASPSLAQAKTVKECQSEWRANKADNEAKGIKEKDYVAQCRGASTSVAAPKEEPARTTCGGFKERKDSQGVRRGMDREQGR